MFLVIYCLRNDRTADPPRFTTREFSVSTKLKNKIRNPEGFRVPNHLFSPVLRALIRASARYGYVIGSADHDVKKNNTRERQKHRCNIRPHVHIDGK